MKRIIDSSVGVKWVMPENDSDKALHLLDDFQNGTSDLFAPDIFLIEAVHAITRAERQRRITNVQGAQAVTDLLNQQPMLVPYVSLLPRAYVISSQARIGVYDCLYVALAEREGCEFVTADDKLIRNLQTLFPLSEPWPAYPKHRSSDLESSLINPLETYSPQPPHVESHPRPPCAPALCKADSGS